VLESAFLTDGSFSEDVIMPAGGSRRPSSPETVQQNLHRLDVPNPQGMKERLDLVSLPNFLSVIREAVERSSYSLSDVRFLALTHMKRSFHHRILEAFGLREEQSFYLEDCGHVQAADQILALERGLACGRVKQGDLVVLAGAGTGYTWAATALRWGT
jgi:3-oxoacyl-[acyl-carrier-protein] synthase-3